MLHFRHNQALVFSLLGLIFVLTPFLTNADWVQALTLWMTPAHTTGRIATVTPGVEKPLHFTYQIEGHTYEADSPAHGLDTLHPGDRVTVHYQTTRPENAALHAPEWNLLHHTWAMGVLVLVFPFLFLFQNTLKRKKDRHAFHSKPITGVAPKRLTLTRTCPARRLHRRPTPSGPPASPERE
jgi:hypothetical protein